MDVGVVGACQALSVNRSTYYRNQAPKPIPKPRSPPPWTLSREERELVLNTLNCPRFGDMAPAEIYATLLQEGRYLCSISTMYRLLRQHQQVRERRKQRRHRVYPKPVLLAQRPNELWSWDIKSWV